jgi:hypothetical protein
MRERDWRPLRDGWAELPPGAAAAPAARGGEKAEAATRAWPVAASSLCEDQPTLVQLGLLRAHGHSDLANTWLIGALRSHTSQTLARNAYFGPILAPARIWEEAVLGGPRVPTTGAIYI